MKAVVLKLQNNGFLKQSGYSFLRCRCSEWTISVGSASVGLACFCLGKNGKGIYICVHRKILDQAKRRQKELTKRNKGRNVRVVMQNEKVFIRGWIGYFYVADMKRILQSWNDWLRRRFRMYIWKQWKKLKTKGANL